MNILYLHGYGSSGQSSTVEYLKKSLPDYYLIEAPDIPVDPAEALPFLKQLCEEERFSVIIGTSMGGMYAHQLPADFARICVNPALHLSEITDVMKEGTFDYFQPRKDGQTQYTITEEIIQHYREMEAHQFDQWNADAPENIFCIGLFGTRDTTVNCRDEFARYYPNVQTFEGGHRMNQKVLKNVVLPIIRRLEEYGRKAENFVFCEMCRDCHYEPGGRFSDERYSGTILHDDEPEILIRRYFAEAEWQRLLKEGVVQQPKEDEPALHVGDAIYGCKYGGDNKYEGAITKIISYTDKYHYKAEATMRPFNGTPIDVVVYNNGLYDAPRVKEITTANDNIETIAEPTIVYQSGTFSVIGGFSMVGTIAYAFQLAVKMRIPTIYFSNQMKREHLLQFQAPKGCPKWITIDDSCPLTVDRMREKVRLLKESHQIQLVIIDFLQLITYDNSLDNANRSEQMVAIARALKCIAEDFNVAVIAISALMHFSLHERCACRPEIQDIPDWNKISLRVDNVQLIPCKCPEDSSPFRCDFAS